MEKIKIAVVGEGPTDYGKWEYSERKRCLCWKEGPIFPIIRNTVDSFQDMIELEAVDKNEVSKFHLQRRSSEKLKGLEGKAKDSVRYSLYLDMHGFDFGIFYCDADKEQGERNTDEHVCKKLFRRVYDEVMKGVEAADIENQVVVPMIPLKMIECWLLADESAFINAFDLPSVSLPSHPELIWGDHKNPDSNYPKRYLERVLCSKEGKRIDSNLENYHLLAEHISIKTLCDRCKISFQCFYDDFNRAMETVSVFSAEPEQ